MTAGSLASRLGLLWRDGPLAPFLAVTATLWLWIAFGHDGRKIGQLLLLALPGLLWMWWPLRSAAMRRLRNVIMPFPGGVVRSGSKVGSKYPALMASTNDAFCPTLHGLVAKSELTPETRCVMEIVIDGLTEADVAAAMRAGLDAGIAFGAERGLLRISAGNYGGKLGPFHFHLHKLMGEGAE